MFKYNPNNPLCKSVAGAVQENEKFNIAVFADSKECSLLLAKDGEDYKLYPMIKSEGGFFVCLENLLPGLYFYRFKTESAYYARGKFLDSAPCLKEEGWDYQLTVYKNGYTAGEILKGKVIYQIFPDRFCKSKDKTVEDGKIFRQDWGGQPTYKNAEGKVLNNEFFGGDFEGIRRKLPYLKELGVGVVYLNPISKAFSSHRYDTGDYLKLDPILGDENDLKKLLKEAENLGISFIFDGVYNHTGADSYYFDRYQKYDGKGAYRSINSPFYSWYDFDLYPSSYKSWWGFENLPSIKKDSKEFQSFIADEVLPYYFELGFKGVRLDVVDELSPSFVKKIRQVAKKYGAIVVGEVWENPTNKLAYGIRRQYFQGEELDSVMNYPLKDAICDYLLHKDSSSLVETVLEQLNDFPKTALDNLMNLLSTHDTVRIINVLGRNEIITNKDLLKDARLKETEFKEGKTLAKTAYSLIFTLYGSPCVYYGDEVGLTGDLDPYNRRCYPWGDEDKEMLEHIKALGKIRKEEAVFSSGNTDVVYHDKKIVIFERTLDGERVVVCASVDRLPVKLKFKTALKNLLKGEKNYRNEFILPPFEALILKEQN